MLARPRELPEGSQMKYLYVLGLEHSGTTLLSQLVSSLPNCMSLGEVMHFLSAPHMESHASRWGKEVGYGRCSCGAQWRDCPFWGPRYALCGLESAGAREDKYADFLASLQGDSSVPGVLVDSSKGLILFDALTHAWNRNGLRPQDLFAVLITRDPRGFLVSMAAKAKHAGKRTGLVACWRALNLWYGANRTFCRAIETLGEERALAITYESLCFEPTRTLDRLCSMLGIGPPTGGVTPDHNDSHIAIGNSDFLLGNRSAVRYDSRWFYSTQVQLAYLMHPRARKLNQLLASRTAT